ncbi:MAG: arginine decarboxylase, pyruvoyl-dependent [Deltaproteobacteria bacterium]|nr:MAG: arginine decarboxylase, pyruvoyl-dependent [Deltaproteobacteria bacterium]
MVPRRIFLTKGVGRHKEKLASFELALRMAKIERYNIVNVSSILPPRAKIVARARATKDLLPGQILHCVVARAQTNEPNRLMCASIGIAIPADRDMYGYISEHHAFGQTERVSGEYAEDLAASMLASTLGIPFDPDQAYDERRDIFRMSQKIVRTRSISQSARADKRGIWTTVLAAAVLLD